MLPAWMMTDDIYTPQKGSSAFISKTMVALGRTMARLRVQRGHEKSRHLPAVVKIIMLLLLIITVSACRNRVVILGIAAFVQVYLCTWPARDILSVLRTSAFAGVLALILFAPAMVMNPSGAANNLMAVAKVFLSVEMVGIFNHTTQWNHMTAALRKLRVPGIVIFTIDITLKYIVLLGTLINDLLTSVMLRSVGRNTGRRRSLAGVRGVTFVRSSEMSKEMYQAMQCRGFTDDYKGL